MRIRYSAAIGAVIGLPAVAMAADVSVKVEVPRMTAAEYHKPYVAIWLEGADQSFAGNLAVWYDMKARNNEGIKWLKDIRQWWRKSGRDLTMPVDGISGATRAPGEYQLAIDTKKAPFDKLAAGQYQLVVEAAREVGGRELVRVPFQWPPAAPQQAAAKGEHELGAVAIDLRP
ncbi:DUF2271 domain-containing protein [soil metagenome]